MGPRNATIATTASLRKTSNNESAASLTSCDGSGSSCECPDPAAPCIECTHVSTLRPKFNLRVIGSLTGEMVLADARPVLHQAPHMHIDHLTIQKVGLAPWLFNLYIDPKEEMTVGHRRNAWLATVLGKQKLMPPHSKHTRQKTSVSECEVGDRVCIRYPLASAVAAQEFRFE